MLDATALDSPPPAPSAAARTHLVEALDLLGYASRNSAQLPSDIVAAVTAADASMRQTGTLGAPDAETRFWNAYSLLHSNRLADDARRRYRYGLYVVLACLLIAQIYFLAGSLTVGRLSQVEDEWQGKATASVKEAGAPPAVTLTPAGPPPPPPTTSASEPAPAPPRLARTDWENLRRFGVSQANYYLGKALISGFDEIKVPANLIPQGYPEDKANFMANYMKLRAELELVLLSLSGYVLPLLYGALGAFAYVMRKLSDPIAKLNFANDTFSNYNLRIHVGALGGLAVGWFVNGDQPVSGVGTLSPLALAFAAGYGSDLIFALLDRVVGAFATPSGLQSSVRSETTRGGIIITSETQRQATLAPAPTPTPATATASQAPPPPPPRLQAAE